jgi:hypothetical protein
VAIWQFLLREGVTKKSLGAIEHFVEHFLFPGQTGYFSPVYLDRANQRGNASLFFHRSKLPARSAYLGNMQADVKSLYGGWGESKLP